MVMRQLRLRQRRVPALPLPLRCLQAVHLAPLLPPAHLQPLQDRALPPAGRRRGRLEARAAPVEMAAPGHLAERPLQV